MNECTNAPKQLEKIRKVSEAVRVLCSVGATSSIVIFGFCAVSLVIAPRAVGPSLHGVRIETSQLGMGHQISLIALWLVILAIVLKGLYHLHKLFTNYAKGNIFTTASVAQIRQFGITLLLAATLDMLVVLPIALVAVTKARHLLREGTTVVMTLPLESLFSGGFLILVSWVMDAGRALREENELTI